MGETPTENCILDAIGASAPVSLAEIDTYYVPKVTEENMIWTFSYSAIRVLDSSKYRRYLCELKALPFLGVEIAPTMDVTVLMRIKSRWP